MLSNVRKATIKPFIMKHVAKGTQTYTDEYSIYNSLEGASSISLFAMAKGSMPEMMTRTEFTRCTSIPWKASGHCFAHGSGLTEGFHRRVCRYILDFSNSFITQGFGTKDYFNH